MSPYLAALHPVAWLLTFLHVRRSSELSDIRKSAEVQSDQMVAELFDVVEDLPEMPCTWAFLTNSPTSHISVHRSLNRLTKGLRHIVKDEFARLSYCICRRSRKPPNFIRIPAAPRARMTCITSISQFSEERGHHATASTIFQSLSASPTFS